MFNDTRDVRETGPFTGTTDNQFKGEPIVEDNLMATKEAQKPPKDYKMTGQDVAKALKFP